MQTYFLILIHSLSNTSISIFIPESSNGITRSISSNQLFKWDLPKVREKSTLDDRKQVLPIRILISFYATIKPTSGSENVERVLRSLHPSKTYISSLFLIYCIHESMCGNSLDNTVFTNKCWGIQYMSPPHKNNENASNRFLSQEKWTKISNSVSTRDIIKCKITKKL